MKSAITAGTLLLALSASICAQEGGEPSSTLSDTKSPEKPRLAPYPTLLTRAIAKAHRLPPDAAALSLSGTVMVSFELDSSGKVVQSKVSKSSGSDTLDQAAMATIQRAQPLPAPPASLAQDDLKFTIPIVYKASSTNQNQQLGAYMVGTCSAPLGVAALQCEYARYYLFKDGNARFYISLSGPNETRRSVSFSGKNGRLNANNDYEIDIETVTLVGPDLTPDGNPKTESTKAVGSCKQTGDFSRREFSSLSCSAKGENDASYSVDMRSDGSLLKARTFNDERLLFAR